MSAVTISIIIATRNRENLLWTTVEKAIRAIKGLPAEIIVVNDGDQPLQIPGASKGLITCFTSPSKGVSAARNYGAAKAGSTIYFFVDDDMWINREAVQWVINQMKADGNSNFVYNLNWQYPGTLNEKLKTTKVGKYILSAQYNTMWGRMHAEGTRPANGLYRFQHIASCSLVMHKNIFDALKGYNESLIFQGEDIDLSARLNKNCIPIFCVFDVLLHHNHADRLDLDGYLQREINGFRCQFTAEKAGLIATPGKQYKRAGLLFLDLFTASEKTWLAIYKMIPDHQFFVPLSNKLTGLLTGLQRYKQWRKIIGKQPDATLKPRPFK